MMAAAAIMSSHRGRLDDDPVPEHSSSAYYRLSSTESAVEAVPHEQRIALTE